MRAPALPHTLALKKFLNGFDSFDRFEPLLLLLLLALVARVVVAISRRRSHQSKATLS
jgi:hypothetical protein